MGRRLPTRRMRTLLASSLGLASTLFFVPPVSAGPFVDAGHAPGAMTAWASAVDEVVRGPMDVANVGLGLASFGLGDNALGAATSDSADVVSLGDGGSATLSFETGIRDGPGDDFAVFENGFRDLNGLFAELAYVEVSTDGLTFVRFDTDALNPLPVPAFDYLDPTEYDGFAGRHEIGLGTGFDLADIAFEPLVLSGDVDLMDIRFVRVVDVVGDGSTTDGGGNAVYDPYATAFPAGGFDLEAIGVLHVPEPGWALGLAIGGLGVGSIARRTRRARGQKRRARNIGLAIALLWVAHPAAALTASFEDLGLGANDFENGSGLAGGFTSGGIFFENDYDPTFGSFTGYAASTMTDTTTPGFGNQFSAFAGSGADGSAAYGIAFFSGSILLPSASVVESAQITNTTYAALSMRNGDMFAKQFGGPTGDDEDFFRLLIEGIDAGGLSTGTVELMLADYRFADNSQDFVLDQWVTLTLSGLGVVTELRFAFESSDVGSFGINTPQYFAIDDLIALPVPVPEPGAAVLIGLGLAGLARQTCAGDPVRR